MAHWLPRTILGGMLAIVLGLMIGMGSYYVYRHKQTFAQQTADIQARAVSERERALRAEVNQLTSALRNRRANLAPTLRAKLRAQVDFVINTIASMHAALNGKQSDVDVANAILRALRPLRGDNGAGDSFVIDGAGIARLFPLDPLREGSNVRLLTDDSGHRFIDDLLDTEHDDRGSFLRFRWTPRGESEAMADAITYARRFEPLNWLVGSSKFLHVARAELKREALMQLGTETSVLVHGIGDQHFIVVLDQDGHLLTGPSALRQAVSAQQPSPMLQRLPDLVDLGRSGGGALQFEAAFTRDGPATRYLAFASSPDEWGWIVVSVAPLTQMDNAIAQERAKMSAATNRDFKVTALTMFAVATLAIVLSVLFYRWIDERFVRYHNDIEARNRALNDNARELRLSAQVFEASNEALAILDHRLRIVSINPAMSRISGFNRSDLIGRHCADLLMDGNTDSSTWLSTIAQIRRDSHWSGELELARPNGPAYPAWVSVGAVTTYGGEPAHFVVSISDISEQKRTEQRLRHLAEYDALTGLPNRVLLLDRMSSAIKTAQRHRHHLAVLFIDLDRFKNINDSLGHAVGDELLRQVSNRLSSLVRNSDTVSRLGGDEFVVLLTELDTAGRAATLATKMLKSLAAPFQLSGHELTVTPSIGITVYPEDGDNRDILLKNADTAMYHAKENGRNSYQFFTRELNERARLRLELENDMRRALARHEFSLAYQPQFDLRTGKLIGAEALVRWTHPERGDIPPDQFIPIAEETGLIVPLGAWILRQACAAGRIWRDEELTEISIAVNVSALQVRRGQLDATVLQVLSETGFPPDLLELEVTESALMANQEHVSTTLTAIRALGVHLAIDDFGTGYSSLAYLKRFPLDKLKIDRSFIDDLPHDAEDAHLTRAIIGIGHHLDMCVIAEGVETEAQEHFLTELGCDQAQGYLYAKPLTTDEFQQMLIDLKYQPTSKPAASTA